MSGKRGFVIFPLFCLIFGLQISAAGQYCGGTLQYVVRDKSGRIIDATDAQVIKNEPAAHAASIYPAKPSDLAPGSSDAGKEGRKPNNIEGIPVSNFAIRMGCGLPLLELSLKLNGDVMNLRFENIVEMDSVLDSLPFQPGTFQIDFHKVYEGYPTDKSNFNITGLKFGNEMILTWHARNFDLIDAKNWRKVRIIKAGSPKV